MILRYVIDSNYISELVVKTVNNVLLPISVKYCKFGVKSMLLFKSEERTFKSVLNNTVCLGSTNIFSIFMFMPGLACYQKVWVSALYCPKMSL